MPDYPLDHCIIRHQNRNYPMQSSIVHNGFRAESPSRHFAVKIEYERSLVCRHPPQVSIMLTEQFLGGIRAVCLLHRPFTWLFFSSHKNSESSLQRRIRDFSCLSTPSMFSLRAFSLGASKYMLRTLYSHFELSQHRVAVPHPSLFSKA
jgi:hypothetical protein